MWGRKRRAFYAVDPVNPDAMQDGGKPHFLDKLKAVVDDVLGPAPLHVCIEAANPRMLGRSSDLLMHLMLSTNFGSANPFAPKLPKSRMALFGQVERLHFDPEGRVILTHGLMEHANISDTAAFIGMGETFQIWQPEAGAAMLKDAIAEASVEFEDATRNRAQQDTR